MKVESAFSLLPKASAQPLGGAHGKSAATAEELLIELLVGIAHAERRESPLGFDPAVAKFNLVDGRNGLRHFFCGIHEETSFAVADDARQRASAKSDDRRPASERFHRHQRTSLAALAGDEHRARLAQQLELLLE